MTLFVQERLDLAAKQAEQSDKTARDELGAAMQSVNDTMMRMMGEMTRTQQGQMDMLGGQLRAAGHQDEERMERMRQTMDRRLSNYEDKLGGVDRMLEARLESSETHMTRLCQTLEGGLQRINDENRAQLEMMRQTVDEKLNETVDQRLEASFSAVTQRLEQVTASLNAMQSLTNSFDELGRMMSGTHPFGVIGEAQLGTILSQMLAPNQYAQHANVQDLAESLSRIMLWSCRGNRENTRFICLLTQAFRCVNIRSFAWRWNTERAQKLKAQEDCWSQQSACMRVACPEKLIAPPYTTDYAVLFLQSEGLFAEVLRIAGLSERVQQESHMILAGPTTLAALISSMQMGFKSLAIEQRTQEVMTLLGAIRTDFAGFASLLNRTQKKLRQATEELDHAQQHTQTIAKRLSDVKGLPQEQAQKLLNLTEDDDDTWD